MVTSASLHLPTTLAHPNENIAAAFGQIALRVVAGAVAALATGIVNPLGGAVFGGVTSAVNRFGRLLIDALPIREEGAKTALRIATFIIAIGLGISGAAFVGSALTTFGAVVMTLSMGVVTVLTEMVCTTRDVEQT